MERLLLCTLFISTLLALAAVAASDDDPDKFMLV